MSQIFAFAPLLVGALFGFFLLFRALTMSPAWFKSWTRAWSGAGLAWCCAMGALGVMASTGSLGWVQSAGGRAAFAALILLLNPASSGALIGALAWWRWGTIDRRLDQEGVQAPTKALDVQRRARVVGAATVHSQEVLYEYAWQGQTLRAVAEVDNAQAAALLQGAPLEDVTLLPAHPALCRLPGRRWVTGGLKAFAIVCGLLAAGCAALFVVIVTGPLA